jgi:damage-control phosphatase, subfamily I
MAELVTDDEWLHNRVLAEMMDFLRKRQYDTTPADLMAELCGRAEKSLGVADPYAERKRAIEDEMVAAEDQFRAQIDAAPKAHQLALAVRLACIANVFDDELLRDVDVSDLFAQSGTAVLQSEVWEDFRRDIKAAKSVLFMHNAAGEVVLDKLLLGRLKDKRIVSVVRARPILGWATAEDAARVGLPGVATTIVDPGADVLGLPLNQCSHELRAAFDDADLVLTKGQAAYETLAGEKKTVYSLFRVKCRVMAEMLGSKIGDLVLEKSEPQPA